MKQALVVDDNADNRELLRALLCGHGFEVRLAHHGAEALALARRQPPDVVVSDLLMPVMDGFALLRAWKTDPQLAPVPFVVYTATYTDARDERLVRDLGADEFLLKPAEPEVVVAALERVLAGAAAGRPPNPSPVGADADATLLAHNEALIRKLQQRALEREQTLQALAASEATWRALFEQSMDMVFLTAPDGRVLSANPAACHALGLDEAAIRARGRAGLVDPASPGLAEILAERAASGHVRGEVTMIRGDGSRFPVELTSSLFTLPGGEVHSSTIARDISERRRIEAELRVAHARQSDLQAALDAHALVSMTDADGRITYANEHFCRVSGYAADELIGRTHNVVNSGHHPGAFFGAMWATIRAGRIWRGEVCNRAKDGTLYWVDATLVPFLDEHGTPYQYVAIRTDITARRQALAERAELERQLRQSQKMEAIGTLAGGIAHDFNNVLGAILGYTALAEQDAAQGEPVLAQLAQIRAAGERARALVQRILAFGREQPTALIAQPLQPLVQETLALLRGTLPAGVALTPRLPEAPVVAAADATQMQQVLLNLATNAWHALPQGQGRVEIGLAGVQLPRDAPLPAGLPPGGYAHLWVRDDGRGMDEATLSRIFDPFFTTKPVGEGTGLGLAIAYRIVHAHHGAVTVDSAPGRGSCLHVWLPLAEAAAAPAPPALETAVVTAVPVPAIAGHVLVIDDDETIALLVERLLRRAGLRVTVYADAAQALAALRADPAAFDLVFSDYHMPRTSGLDVARAAAAIAPGRPVVIASGHVDVELARTAREAGVSALVRKERLAEDLVPTLRRVLGARAEP